MRWMKKTAVILSAALLLSGCGESHPNTTTASQNFEVVPTVTQPQSLVQIPQEQVVVLTAEKMTEIENAWYAVTNTELDSWYTVIGETATDGARYYGNCGGYDVLLVPTGEEGETNLTVGGITFTVQNVFELYAYKDGQFCELKDVYLQGLITDEDLEAIARAHRIAQRRIKPLFSQPGSDVELYELMKDAFMRQFVSEGAGTKNELSILYYGEYDGAHVAFINGIFSYTQAMTSEKVGKLTFHYNTGQRLLLYYEGELMYLPQAYERGILSDEAVAKLHRTYQKPSSAETE
jgi:hypothetical protein